jgi:hypothetical protein
LKELKKALNQIEQNTRDIEELKGQLPQSDVEIEE